MLYKSYEKFDMNLELTDVWIALRHKHVNILSSHVTDEYICTLYIIHIYIYIIIVFYECLVIIYILRLQLYMYIYDLFLDDSFLASYS